MNKVLIFDVLPLMDVPTGTRTSYLFQGDVKLEEINIKGKMTGRVELMRLDDGINVRVENLKVGVIFKCGKCLENYVFEMDIQHAEREFYLNRPEKVDDPCDLFLINKKNFTVDIEEMLRQEIILHFPSNLVCSTRCEGLCPICGTNKNKKKCKCKIENLEENKPLAVLKKLKA